MKCSWNRSRSAGGQLWVWWWLRFVMSSKVIIRPPQRKSHGRKIIMQSSKCNDHVCIWYFHKRHLRSHLETQVCTKEASFHSIMKIHGVPTKQKHKYDAITDRSCTQIAATQWEFPTLTWPHRRQQGVMHAVQIHFLHWIFSMGGKVQLRWWKMNEAYSLKKETFCLARRDRLHQFP